MKRTIAATALCLASVGTFASVSAYAINIAAHTSAPSVSPFVPVDWHGGQKHDGRRDHGDMRDGRRNQRHDGHDVRRDDRRDSRGDGRDGRSDGRDSRGDGRDSRGDGRQQSRDDNREHFHPGTGS
jgi:hypothetical protein